MDELKEIVTNCTETSKLDEESNIIDIECDINNDKEEEKGEIKSLVVPKSEISSVTRI